MTIETFKSFKDLNYIHSNRSKLYHKYSLDNNNNLFYEGLFVYLQNEQIQMFVNNMTFDDVVAMVDKDHVLYKKCIMMRNNFDAEDMHDISIKFNELGFGEINNIDNIRFVNITTDDSGDIKIITEYYVCKKGE